MTIRAFDFDGTLTRHDSLWMFLRHAEPRRLRFYAKVAAALPGLLVAVVASCAEKFLPGNRLSSLANSLRSRAKEKLLQGFLRGLTVAQVESLASSFADVIEADLRPDTLQLLEESVVVPDDKTVIVSASPSFWISPWARRRSILVVASSVDFLTGPDSRIRSLRLRNCNGEEKPREFLQRFPLRHTYRLEYFGDSPRHDGPMLRLADRGTIL